MAFRKSYEVVGWSYDGALYCVDHEPHVSDATDIATYIEHGIPSPIFLDEITSHDVCDLCLIPLDA